MKDLTDQQLLRAYAERRSEAAFAELARRHVNLVYSSALRMVRDGHLAEDVTQAVFSVLAQNARRLRNRAALPGWLHHTTQHLAANAVRADVRRRAREQAAAAMTDLLATESSPSWEVIAPHLDAALGALSEAERDAVLLRYFESRSLREVGQALGTSDDTAQKRVSRAVDRLREFLSKRGVSVGASGLTAVISANAVQAAPVSLVAAISSVGAAASVTAAETMAMTTVHKAIVAVVLAVAVGTAIYETRQVSRLQGKIEALQRRETPLREQIVQLAGERDAAARPLAGLRDDNQRLITRTTELLRLRAEVARLHTSRELARLRAIAATGTNDLVTAAVKSRLAGLDRIERAVERTPEAVIPEFQYLRHQDWWGAAKMIASGMDEGYVLHGLRFSAENQFAQLLQPALQKYLEVHDSQFPTELAQLQPYLKSPVEDAVLERWKIVPASDFPKDLGNRGQTTYVITQRAPPVDEERDSRWLIEASALTATKYQPIPGP